MCQSELPYLCRQNVLIRNFYLALVNSLHSFSMSVHTNGLCFVFIFQSQTQLFIYNQREVYDTGIRKVSKAHAQAIWRGWNYFFFYGFVSSNQIVLAGYGHRWCFSFNLIIQESDSITHFLKNEELSPMFNYVFSSDIELGVDSFLWVMDRWSFLILEIFL